VRNASQGTARIKGGAKERGGTTKVGVRKERLGTQRVGGKRSGRIGGGTTVMGGGRQKDAGPRGLFGGRSGRRDTQLVKVSGLLNDMCLPSVTFNSWVQPPFHQSSPLLSCYITGYWVGTDPAPTDRA
jgi:hypothetical protein